MFNKALMMLIGGVKANGRFTVKAGKSTTDPFGGGLEEFFTHLYGYGIAGSDFYVQENLGSVSPDPVMFNDHALECFCFADSRDSGWYGLRVRFDDVGTSESDWPEQIKVISHSSGYELTLSNLYLGLYGDPGGGEMATNVLADLTPEGKESVWEIQKLANQGDQSGGGAN